MESLDEDPEEGTAKWRRNVLYSMIADEFRPPETVEYYDLVLSRVDTPERVWNLYCPDPTNPGEHLYVTTINLSAFKDSDELRRYMGTIGTRYRQEES